MLISSFHPFQFIHFRTPKNSCQNPNHDPLGLHLSIHLPLPLCNNMHSIFGQLITPWMPFNHTKANNDHPKSHHHQLQWISQATHHHHCTASLQFHLPLHHITLTNHTSWLSFHALLYFPLWNDNMPPYYLPFNDLIIFVDDDFRDHSRAF